MEGTSHLVTSRWLLAMDNRYTNKRIKEIASVFIKHGFKNGLGDPKQMKLALEELGPTFIKIGQLLSTRADLLPIEYIAELQKLQDNVNPESFTIMKKVIEDELKIPIEEAFSDFEETPIASASISEVFLAKLKTGEKVAVKVQRPLVKEKMLSDIRILKKLAHLINLAPTKDIIDLNKVVEELSNAAERELNFLLEMENIIKFSENNKDIKFISCPKVYEKYCTDKILVMDYISGIKIDDINRLKKEGYDLQDIATKITYNYFKQVFEDGFFHADPHPGNILIHNNTIGYIDFGLMGTLSINLRKKLNQLLEGVATRNIDLIMKSLLAICIKKGPIEKDNLYNDIELFYNTYIDKSIDDFDIPKLFEDIIELAKNNNMNMPHDIILLAKGTITLQAVLAKIDEKLTIMDIAIPYFKDQIVSNKLKEIDFGQLLALLYSSAKSSINIPNKLLEFLNAGLEGRLRLYFDVKNIDETINNINKMINRLTIAIVVAGLLVSSSLVINANIGLKIYGISSIGIFGYVSAGLAGLILLISIFRSGKL